MPIRLIPPRKGASPFYRGRGTYLGRYVDRTTKASSAALARKVIDRWKREIERGEFREKGAPTFVRAAVRYGNAGHDCRFLDRIGEHLGEAFLLADVTQDVIEDIALELYPDGSPATRNRQVYTPISAVLKHSGITFGIKRPKGSGGNKQLRWLWPEEAERVFAAAAEIDREFATFLIFLCYTGLRLGEALSIPVRDVRLDEGFAYLPTSKNDEAQPVFLPPFVIATLAAHPRGLERPKDRLFRFVKGGHLYTMFRASFFKAEVDLGERDGFHILRHTWATWMRRYAGLDTRALIGTDRWKDPKSANRYAHVVVSEDAKRAVMLPVPKVRSV
jgi:integrase